MLAEIVESVTTQPALSDYPFLGPPTFSGIVTGFCIGCFFVCGLAIWCECREAKKAMNQEAKVRE